MFERDSAHEFGDLSSEDTLSVVLERSAAEPVVIFKHSNICGLSSMADRELRKFRARHGYPVYRITVQRARKVSDAIESLFGVRHETPQAIVVVDGSAVFHASHWHVTAENMAEGISAGGAT